MPYGKNPYGIFANRINAGILTQAKLWLAFLFNYAIILVYYLFIVFSSKDLPDNILRKPR